MHNEAIVEPETIDCIRALTELELDARESIRKTDAALGITKTFLPATTRPVPHLAGADVEHPEIEAVRARRAGFREIGFKGSEEPTDVPATAPQRG